MVIVIELFVEARTRIVLGAVKYSDVPAKRAKMPSPKLKAKRDMTQEASLKLRQTYSNLYADDVFLKIVQTIPENFIDKDTLSRLKKSVQELSDDDVNQLRLLLRAFKNLVGMMKKQEFEYSKGPLFLETKNLTKEKADGVFFAMSLLSDEKLDVDDLSNHDYVIFFYLLFPLFEAGILIIDKAKSRLLFASFWVYSDTSQEVETFQTRLAQLSQAPMYNGFYLNLIVVSHKKEKRKTFKNLEIVNGTTYLLNIFTYDQLTIDITTHCLAPTSFRKLKQEEITDLKKSDFKSLQTLYKDDALAKVYGLTDDDVVEAYMPNLIKATGPRSTLLSPESLIISRVKKVD